jgi:hypothetical protein
VANQPRGALPREHKTVATHASATPRDRLAGVHLSDRGTAAELGRRSIASLTVLAAIGWSLAACDPLADAAGLAQTAAPSAVPAPGAPAPDGLLWVADHEAGDLRQWQDPGTVDYDGRAGGDYLSGEASADVSVERARSGRYSVKLTISTPPSSGARLFRWAEPEVFDDLYYSAWYYFPEALRLTGEYTNHFQWKNRTPTSNDPVYFLRIDHRPAGAMYFTLDRSVEFGFARHHQQLADVPVGRWFQVEAFYRCAPDRTGRVTVWQDGVRLFDLAGVRTRSSDGQCQWSVNHYADSVVPRRSSIFVDDAAIARGRIGPLVAANPTLPPPQLSLLQRPGRDSSGHW